MIKHISVYDFDGSIANSPLPTPENKALWEKNNGMAWRHKGNGWWGKIESLCPSFDVQCVTHVKEAAIADIEDPFTYTALVTGRMPLFSKLVKEILRNNGVPYFDAYHFNDTHNTLSFKLKVFEQLRNEFPEVTHFTIWEDRIEHIPHFVEWGEKQYGDNFTLHEVRI
jgi:hypothetical protein